MNRKPAYHKGRWAVARERFRLSEARPPLPPRDPVRLNEALAGAMKTLGLESAHWLETLGNEWPRLVGAAVARHTRPGRLDRNRLIVFVDSSVWLNELSRYGRKEMLAALRQRFGDGKFADLAFQLDPDA